MKEEVKSHIVDYIYNLDDLANKKKKVKQLRVEIGDLEKSQKERERKIMNTIESFKGGMTAENGPFSFYYYGTAYLLSIQRAIGSDPRKLIVKEIEELTK